MRDIKFKVWDKINNKMYDYGSDEACELLEDGVDFMGMSFLSCQPNVVWLQYTGEKDIQGKEIYDGDIIVCGDGKVPTQILWVDEYGGWGAKNLRRNEIHALDKYFKRYIGAIIGNIYTNSELLER